MYVRTYHRCVIIGKYIVFYKTKVDKICLYFVLLQDLYKKRN